MVNMKLNFFRWTPRVKQHETPLVFLHGMGGTGKIWRPIAAQLEESFDCICPDQRGHGGSRPVPENEDSYRAQDYAQDLIELLSSIPSDAFDENSTPGVGKCFLIGHSMGVRTVLATAALSLDRPGLPFSIGGVIAVDISITSAWGGGIGIPLANFLENLPASFFDRTTLRDYLYAHCPDPSIAQYLTAVAVKSANTDPDTLTTFPERWTFPFDVQALVKTVHAANDAKIEDWVMNILNAGIPILFLRGMDSKVWLKEDYEKQKLKFQHPLLTFEEWPNCGHGLPFEQRVKFTERVKQFVTTT
jgi:pimeloyl-ACP methyl ester carboxylesterase